MSINKKISVIVPATSANMGSGFDSIGLALDLWNELTVTSGKFSFNIHGEGENELPKDESNLVYLGVKSVYDLIGESVPSLTFLCNNKIPFSRGMGSSSAAIVSGLLVGNYISNSKLTNEKIFELAANIEGHADNVAPAIYGGCSIGIKDEKNGWIIDKVNIKSKLNAVIFIPDMILNTDESRMSLHSEISRTDAVYNIGRAALLVNSLSSGNYDLLKFATQDKLHQKQRSKTYRAMPYIIEAGIRGGAYCCYLSGSGSSIIALSDKREYTIGYEMAETARTFGINGKTMVVPISDSGARVKV